MRVGYGESVFRMRSEGWACVIRVGGWGVSVGHGECEDMGSEYAVYF